jgi:predicted ferric reductase
VVDPAPAGPAAARPAGEGNDLVLALAFWLGLVSAVLPWWLNTEPGSLRDLGAVYVEVGRITGLVSGYLMLVQVLLLSRLDGLERAVGAERLIRLHRDLGAAVVVLVVAHAATTILGYAELDNTTVPAATAKLWSTYEDMVGAFVAAGLLVLIGVLSVRAVRRVLSYERWYAAHLLVYPVLLLGYGHQFANGQDLYTGPGRWFWIAVYLAVLAAWGWGRVVAPLRLNARHRFEVADVVVEGPGVVSVYVTGEHLDELRVRAGQFFRWRFLAAGYRWQAHPFSLSAAPNGRWLRLTAKVVGDHTGKLVELPIGTRVFAEGPSGGFTADRRTRPRALLVAGGIGVTPIRALLEELPPNAVVLYRVREAGDVVFADELDWLADTRGADVQYLVGSRDDPGPRALASPDGLFELVPDLLDRDVYLCGPPGLVESTLAALAAAGVPKRQIHLDAFEF